VFEAEALEAVRKILFLQKMVFKSHQQPAEQMGSMIMKAKGESGGWGV